MIIKNWFTQIRTVVNPETDMEELKLIFASEDVNTLPVVDKEKNYYGLIHFSDIADAEETENVLDYTTSKHLFIFDDYTMEDVSLLLMDNHEIVIPVLNKELKYLGTITIYEILESFATMLSFDKRAISISFKLRDKPGQLKAIVDIFAHENLNIISIFTYPDDEGQRTVFLKLDSTDVKSVERILAVNELEPDYLKLRKLV